MSEYGFEGRVVVVTGAGRGIGRGYAQLLAERGAKVVVNDLGGTPEGDGADLTPAQAVVAEIEAAGGTALADGSDVSTTEGGQAVVGAALAAFGRIDAVVANAGIMRWAGLPEATAADLRAHLDVHLLGTFTVVEAAWRHFVEQGYGRIVTTGSAGMFGLPDNLAYAAAKGGILGLSRSLAVAGADHGILVNVIAPNAWTRLAGDGGSSLDGSAADAPPGMDPALVAPMVALLAHERCPGTGDVYAAGAGRFARIFLASTPGYLHPDGTPTIEDVAANLDAVRDEQGYTVPRSLMEWAGGYMAHLYPAATG